MCFIISCYLCVFYHARAPDCAVDTAFEYCICFFGNGLQDVSKFYTVASCQLRVVASCRPLNCDLNVLSSQYSHPHVENAH